MRAKKMQIFQKQFFTRLDLTCVESFPAYRFAQVRVRLIGRSFSAAAYFIKLAQVKCDMDNVNWFISVVHIGHTKGLLLPPGKTLVQIQIDHIISFVKRSRYSTFGIKFQEHAKWE